MNHTIIMRIGIVFFSIIFLAGFNQKVLGTSYVAIDLNPSGFTNSEAYGIDGEQIVGFGFKTTSPQYSPEIGLLWSGSAHGVTQFGDYTVIFGVKGGQQVGGFVPWVGACVWQGTPESVTVLQSGYCMALDTDGVHQVGCGGDMPMMYHALLWSGNAESVVDLNPDGCNGSYAYGVDGDYQVGYGYLTPTQNAHALLWNGSATKYLDLNPSGYSSSLATGISGSQQVGEGWGEISTNEHHALLWNGTAASAVDLNPSGFTSSGASGTNGTQQVGSAKGATTGGNNHALVWNGTAEDYVDLHQFLSSGFIKSKASAIDGQGNIVGYATDSAGNNHAILWQPVPEPATFVMLGMGALFLGLFCRRKQTR
jgi:hypothetical protein